MAQIIVGLEQLNVKLDKLKTANAEKAMKEACMAVERDAKLFCPPNGGRYPRAPFNGDPENTTPYSSTGDLRNSIMLQVIIHFSRSTLIPMQLTLWMSINPIV